jgi:hypothetical protein
MNEWISAERVYVADVPKEMPHRYFECTLGIGTRHCLLSLLLAERSIIAVPPANTVEPEFRSAPRPSLSSTTFVPQNAELCAI